jgi:hypothetical protein
MIRGGGEGGRGRETKEVKVVRLEWRKRKGLDFLVIVLTTSVYLVASTLIKGASAKVLSRRAISVFPVPVGPFIKIFEGVTSARISSGN